MALGGAPLESHDFDNNPQRVRLVHKQSIWAVGNQLTVLLSAGPKFTRKNLVRSDFIKPFPAWGMFLKVLNFKSQYDSCFCCGKNSKIYCCKKRVPSFFLEECVLHTCS